MKQDNIVANKSTYLKKLDCLVLIMLRFFVITYLRKYKK